MTLSAAAVVGLLVAGGEPIVHSVRIEHPAEKRLLSYVEIHPGEHLRVGAVRRAVELLHATGEFEDVVVETADVLGGVNVVFRPRPAPRLRAVRLEGDPVLSPGALRRIARLQRLEALWPSRLDEAASDVRAALVARGYLEAEVKASANFLPDRYTGADAVFHVRAGPRARVGSSVISPPEAPEAALIAALAAPRPGEVYRQQKARRARDAMKRRLVDSGRWRARVELFDAYDPATARVALTFVLEAGPWVALEFQGAIVPGSLHNQVRDLLREGGLGPDVLEEAAERIEESFRRRGHREVEVHHRQEPRTTGLAVVYEIDAGPRATVASVRMAGDAEAAIGFSPATRPEQPLDERQVDEDAHALTRLLEDRGHPEAKVETELPGGGGPVPVVFRVRAGPRTVVAEATVEAPLPPAAGEESPRELRVREGVPYRARDVAADREALLAAYRNAGYLAVEVTPETTFSEDQTEARIRFRVAPGPRTFVDRVVVAGLDHTREKVVRRELLVGEGEPLGLQGLLESQRRLGTLGIFDRVGIAQLDPEAERRSLVVSLAEGPRTTIAYGIGGSERDIVRGSVELGRRNIFGMDRTLSVFARASVRATRFLVSFREPYFLGRRHELFVTGFREEEERDSFSFRRYGGFVQTARALTPRLSLIARYAFQDTDVFQIDVPIDEIDREFRTYTASGPSFSILNDTRDNPIDPRRGRFVGTDVEFSFPFLGGDPFLKGYLQAATYRRLSARAVLALSGRVGLSGTFGTRDTREAPIPEQLPLPERFFAGGPYSLRGFATDKAGPLVEVNGEQLATGGNALLVASAELRMEATRYLEVAAFADAGNVYPLVSDMSLGDVRYTAGVGLRYKTSLGPLRVDWGYKLNRRAGESASQLHIAIGHAF